MSKYEDMVVENEQLKKELDRFAHKYKEHDERLEKISNSKFLKDVYSDRYYGGIDVILWLEEEVEELKSKVELKDSEMGVMHIKVLQTESAMKTLERKLKKAEKALKDVDND